jgi:TolA-binding protein
MLGKNVRKNNAVQKGATPMKRLVCVLAMSLLLWPACSTGQNRASQDVDNAAETARQEKQMYQDRVEANLRDLDRQIGALKAKIAKENEVERRHLDQQMAELERKREVAHQKLEKLETSSQEAWGDMKTGIDAAMEDLQSAYERAAADFK